MDGRGLSLGSRRLLFFFFFLWGGGGVRMRLKGFEEGVAMCFEGLHDFQSRQSF